VSEHNPWANTRIHVLGPQKRKPKAGDRRETKKHGVQVRVHERHNGMLVRSGSRYRYDWVSLSDPRAASYLTPDERLKAATASKATTGDPTP
jgi:hypothetical protein